MQRTSLAYTNGASGFERTQSGQYDCVTSENPLAGSHSVVSHNAIGRHSIRETRDEGAVPLRGDLVCDERERCIRLCYASLRAVNPCDGGTNGSVSLRKTSAKARPQRYTPHHIF